MTYDVTYMTFYMNESLNVVNINLKISWSYDQEIVVCTTLSKSLSAVFQEYFIQNLEHYNMV